MTSIFQQVFLPLPGFSADRLSQRADQLHSTWLQGHRFSKETAALQTDLPQDPATSEVMLHAVREAHISGSK